MIYSLNFCIFFFVCRSAFQCLQLVFTDFLPTIPYRCYPLCVETASKFGSQRAELNVSLTAVGLLWNLSDYFFQNVSRLQVGLAFDDVILVIPFDFNPACNLKYCFTFYAVKYCWIPLIYLLSKMWRYRKVSVTVYWGPVFVNVQFSIFPLARSV